MREADAAREDCSSGSDRRVGSRVFEGRGLLLGRRVEGMAGQVVAREDGWIMEEVRK